MTDLLYPSIKPNIHSTLTVLLSSNPNPNPEIIKVWAQHLTINVNSGTEVAVDDIATWIRVHQDMNVLDVLGSSAYSPLTPPESTSPEPQTDDSAMELDSPAATLREILAESVQSYNFQDSWNINKEEPLSSISLRQKGSDFLQVQWQTQLTVADALSPRPPRVRRHEYAMDIDTSRTSAASMSLPVPFSRQPGLMAQYSSSQLPVPPPPKKTPISDVIRGLNLLAIPLPSASSSSCSQQLSPLPNNLSEVIKRQSHTANVAQRFLDMLDGGKLKVLGWPQNLNSAAGGDPFT
ncbi:hypothetical protein FIBSPDRAFT_863659 [Athelia psychrophila]|uniref:Uncharacterized protein n=1 Tax=Athelia psychrophila TaxID=1759441 RepID=A0A166HAE2_9AGAM|nr:hypothetical protein FIBSPDRAFT_863659 [Fibularhizoctonia sp. CBS 109695]